MLADGAIDEQFAFSRSQFVALTAAKIELSDKISDHVPDADVYLLEQIKQIVEVMNCKVTDLLSNQKNMDQV